jgi:hypothetical protein
LKVIAPVTDPAAAISFEREVQSTGGLLHENVLRIIDQGNLAQEGQEALFVVAEYCADGDYRKRLAGYRARPFDVSVIASDFRQILVSCFSNSFTDAEQVTMARSPCPHLG